jgi:hypothetical protein
MSVAARGSCEPLDGVGSSLGVWGINDRGDNIELNGEPKRGRVIRLMVYQMYTLYALENEKKIQSQNNWI